MTPKSALFPLPYRWGTFTRWKRGDIRAYIAELTKSPKPEPSPDDDQLLSAKSVAEYMDISTATVWRRVRERQQGRGDGAAAA